MFTAAFPLLNMFLKSVSCLIVLRFHVSAAASVNIMSLVSEFCYSNKCHRNKGNECAGRWRLDVSLSLNQKYKNTETVSKYSSCRLNLKLILAQVRLRRVNLLRWHKTWVPQLQTFSDTHNILQRKSCTCSLPAVCCVCVCGDRQD